MVITKTVLWHTDNVATIMRSRKTRKTPLLTLCAAYNEILQIQTNPIYEVLFHFISIHTLPE